MAMIKITSKDEAIHGKDNIREITVQEPDVFCASTLEEIVNLLDEDLAIHLIKSQMKVPFRAVIRRKLEEKDDNDDYVNSDEEILAEDLSDWKPTLRITKTAEEKAREALGGLSPEVREALLASFTNA